MNGNRETFTTFAAEYSREKRTPKFSVESPSLPIDTRDIRSFDYDSVVLPRAEDTTRFEINPFSAFVQVAEKLKGADRAKYVVTGTLWTVAALAALALNSIVLVLDGGLLNIFATSASYLAFKQFKAAITGTPHTCLEFKCTNAVIKDRVGEIFAYVKTFFKKLFSGNNTCIDCVAPA
jgi:hypothetical protein